MAHRLVIQRRGRRPQIFRLVQPTVVVGRGQGTDLLLPDISVSRQHARVERTGEDDHTITDLGSQNGTKINGVRVTEHLLRHGDELQIGKFLLTYEKKTTRTTDEESDLGAYTLDEERSGYLDAITATDGSLAHDTTSHTQAELDDLRQQARIKQTARLVATETGDTYKIGEGGLRFGKHGLTISGGGLGGSARIDWEGAAHVIEKMGGVFFSVTVNGSKIVEPTNLEVGDQIVIGKSAFRYET